MYTEELGTIEETPDVLVVDEAHNIVGNSLTKNSQRDTVKKSFFQVSVLLLLSATPPLRDNEEKYFRLLKLLDPVVIL